jgi:two-component system sensor histidine kinase/response regulator
MRNVKLLLIEDDEDDYILTKDLLDQIAPGKYTLDWAPSASIAKGLLRENKHDLCLMDYRLGADDGIKLLRDAPRLGYEGPVIMLTGQDDSQLDAEALAAGAVDYLVKADLNAAHLARAIRYALSRREMEVERLERLKAEAENRSKSEFLAHLSHELRTPLTAILGYTDLLISRHENADTKAQLQIVKRNGSHLLSLLNDILDLSKIEAGKLEIEVQDLELSPFLADIQALMHMSARDKNLQLKFNTDRDLPQTIQTDPTRLRQILLNLLGNAIKFTDAGSVELSIDVVTKGDKDLIQFAVTDSGIGISKDDINKIFQPFAQAQREADRHQSGTGLGLAISRQLAQRLGGDIEVVSEPGCGSTFLLTVDPGDLQNVDHYRLPIEQDVAFNGSAQRRHLQGKVLVVDDLPDIRELVGYIIERAGATVEFATNGKEAVDKVKHAEGAAEPFGLVVMDIHMPELDGHQATRALRAEGYDGPILALTAATMKGEKERCLNSGFTGHMSKPVDANKLLQTIDKYLVPPAQAKTPESRQDNQRVLLVEDNADARAATSALVELLGWHVESAQTGQQALQKAAEGEPSIVLLDLHLPDTDGYSLATELRSRGLQTARIVALSGADLNRQKAKAAGISNHLLKPVGIEDLKQILSGL